MVSLCTGGDFPKVTKKVLGFRQVTENVTSTLWGGTVNAKRILELLAEEGIEGDSLARAAALLKSTRATGGEKCLGCGAKTLRRDYVCGACSAAKAEHPRRFWSWAESLAEGGDGRPKALKNRPQELPQQTERKRFEYLREIGEIRETPQERFEFLVSVGRLSRVVVASYGFEAIRAVKAIHDLSESATHSVVQLGRTDADFTDIKAERNDWVNA